MMWLVLLPDRDGRERFQILLQCLLFSVQLFVNSHAPWASTWVTETLRDSRLSFLPPPFLIVVGRVMEVGVMSLVFMVSGGIIFPNQFKTHP